MKRKGKLSHLEVAASVPIGAGCSPPVSAVKAVSHQLLPDNCLLHDDQSKFSDICRNNDRKLDFMRDVGGAIILAAVKGLGVVDQNVSISKKVEVDSGMRNNEVGEVLYLRVSH